MLLDTYRLLIIYGSMLLVFISCTNNDKNEILLLEHIYRYKENNDLTNLKWYLMYNVESNKLVEPFKTIVLLERKLMGLDEDVSFNLNYESLDIFVKAMKTAYEEKQVAAADLFTEYLSKDDKILISPLLSAHIATLLFPAFDLIKADLHFIVDYHDALLLPQINNADYLTHYYQYTSEFIDAINLQIEDKYEYSKLTSSATLSQMMERNDQNSMQNLCGHLLRTVLLNKFNSYDTIHTQFLFDFYNKLKVSDNIRNKYISLLFTTKMVNGKLLEEDIKHFEPNENCAMHAFSKIYFYQFLDNKAKVKSYIDQTIHLTEDSNCSYFRSLADKELINYFYENHQKNKALEILLKNESENSCHPMIHRNDLKTQYKLMATSFFMDQCQNGALKYCVKADSICIEIEKYIENNQIDLFHYSNLASSLGINRLKMYNLAKGKPNLNKLIEIYRNSKTRQLLINANNLENKIVSNDTLQLLNKLKAEKADLINKINQLESSELLKSKLHIALLKKHQSIMNLEKMFHLKTPLINDNHINVENIQKWLSKNNSNFLDFINDESDLFVLNIAHDTFMLHHIALTQALKDSIQAYKSIIKNSQSNLHQCKSLGKFLSVIFKTETISSESVIICPSGIVYDLPFESLVDRENKYWVEKSNIQYVFNIGMIKERKSMINPTIATFAFSDATTAKTKIENWPELSFTNVEVANILKSFPQGKSYTGTKCNRSSLIQSFTSDILQISTHAVSDPSNLYNNYIVLRNDAKEDRFYGYDFEKSKIKTNLVVLNGCETQIGPSFAGEGEFSLARSIKNAGVANVISTRWKINDQGSAEFMKYFYTQLSKDSNYSKSLQNAQIKLLSSSQYTHPYYWAGYGLF